MTEQTSGAHFREKSRMSDEDAVPFTGTVTSYAQQFEDVMLWRALRHVGKGLYIDLGAAEPVEYSVSFLFYERGWRGIHVEPSRKQADKLRLARPDEVVIEAAVSDKSGGKILFAETDSDDFLGLCTADKESQRIIETHGVMTHSYDVKQISIDDVFKETNGRDVHWLKIDVEGFEKKAIQGWTSQCRPWVVLVESIIPLENIPNYKEWEPALKKLGYLFVWSDRVNRFYIHENHQELRQFFRDAPNVLDGFVLGRTSDFCKYIEAERAAVVTQHLETIIQRDDALVQRDVAVSQSNSMRDENTQLTAELYTVRGHSIALAESIARLEAERDRLNEEARSLALALQRADLECGSFAEKLAGESAKYTQLTADFHAARGRLDALAENILRLEAERSRTVEEGRALAVALKALEIENERLLAVNAVSSEKNTSLMSKLDTARECAESLRENNEVLLENLALFEKVQNKFSAEFQALTFAHSESKAENVLLLDELGGVREQNETLSQQNTHLTAELAVTQERVTEILRASENKSISFAAAWRNAAETHAALWMNFQAVSEQFSAIRSSTIWRMTAPLRWLLNCMKRLFRWFLPVSRVLWMRNLLKIYFPSLFCLFKNSSSIYGIYCRMVYGKVRMADATVALASSSSFPLPPLEVFDTKSSFQETLSTEVRSSVFVRHPMNLKEAIIVAAEKWPFGRRIHG